MPDVHPAFDRLGSPPQPDLGNLAATRQAYITYLDNERDAAQQAIDRIALPSHLLLVADSASGVPDPRPTIARTTLEAKAAAYGGLTAARSAARGGVFSSSGLTAAISHFIHRYTDLPSRDLAGLLDLSGQYAVTELAVNPADWIADRSLADLALRDEGVVVLGLHRPEGHYLGAPTGRTLVAAGDVLIVYGRGELLRELDDRPRGPDGDLAHHAAVARQQRQERER